MKTNKIISFFVLTAITLSLAGITSIARAGVKTKDNDKSTKSEPRGIKVDGKKNSFNDFRGGGTSGGGRPSK